MTDDPDEIITLAYCPGCEQETFPKDAANVHDLGTQLHCPRCGTRLSADSLYDYVDIRTVDYE